MKILSAETNLASATSVNNSSVLRVFNSDSSNTMTVTRKTASGSIIGSFTIPSGKVTYCEKDYTDTIEGGANLKVSQVAFSPMMSFASFGVEAGPTYSYSVSSSNVDEGGSFTTTITTSQVDDGTTLYWELSGTNVTSSDFSSGALTGSVTISSNSASFSHTLDQDNVTEDVETIYVKLYTDSGRNTQVGNTLTVTVADTSTTPTGDFSAEFDGSNDRMTLAATSDFAFGTGDFTMEAYVFRTSDPTPYARLWHFGPFYSSNDTVGICFDDADHPNKVTFTSYKNRNVGGVNAAGRVLISSTSVESNRWYHIAITRASGTFRLFINGALEDTETGVSSSLESSENNTLAIGGTVDRMVEEPFAGRVSNLRIIKGQSLYSSNFTPPATALTTTSQSATSSNVKLLCCKTSTLTDADVKPGTITVEGAVSSTEDPFAPGAYSGTFDGDDSVTVPNGSGVMDLADNDFTIECWFKAQTSGNPGTHDTLFALSNYGDGTNTNAFSFYAHDNGGLKIFNRVGTGYVQKYQESGLYDLDKWVHFAWNRNGTTNKIFIDGIETGTYEDQHNFTDGQNLYIGANDYNQNGTANQYGLNGNISNVRVTIGQTLYNSNFTPSTTALTATSQGANASNVKFLGLQNPIITTPTVGTGDMTVTGDAYASNVDPFSVDYAALSYSSEFSGNGFLSMSASPDYNVGTGNFTIEMWVKGTNTNSQGSPSYIRMFQTDNPSTTYNANGSNQILQVTMQPGTGYLNTWSMGSGSGESMNIIGSTNIMDGNWNHIATVRNGSTITQYVNGTAEGSKTGVANAATFNNNGNTGNRPRVGANNTGSGNATMKISNVRLTVGTALYTGNFSVPTSSFTSQSGALVMCNKSSVTTATKAHSGYTITKTNTVAASSDDPFD